MPGTSRRRRPSHAAVARGGSPAARLRSTAVALIAAAVTAVAGVCGAQALTPWERYLATLDPAAAAVTRSMSYGAARSPADRLGDLALLATQVSAGDDEAYRLALRLADASAPGETLQVLAEMIGTVVRIRPAMFLRGQQDAPHCFGADALGPDFVDRPPAARAHEIRMRIEAIRGVADPALARIRQACLAALR